MRKLLVLTAVAVGLSGCAQIPDGAGTDPSDPFEVMNRHVFAINMAVDDAVIHPVVSGYRDHVPEGVRNSVHNAIENLSEPANAVNNALQGKSESALASVFRLLINTTFGLGGLFDVAGTVGNVQVRDEDFGQTLGVWGIGPGPFLMLPVLGPSSLRDAGALVPQLAMHPSAYIDNRPVMLTNIAVRGLDMRYQALPATDLLEGAVDPYAMARQGYLAARKNAVYDGNPPMELLADEFEDEDDKKGEKK